MRECEVGGCGRSVFSRGWCQRHYGRWYRNGDPNGGRRSASKSPEESFEARTEWVGGCLLWTGATNGTGYGVIKLSGRNVGAHRWVYEKWAGTIPDGMMVDHMCHNRACVFVDHLRVVTRKQNAENRRAADSDSATGVRGVFPHGNGYRVAVVHNGEAMRLGTFPTVEEAEVVAIAARKKYFTHSIH